MKHQEVSFTWVSSLSADAPDHLQARPSAPGRVEYQLVYQVADHGEPEPAMVVRLAREIRNAETATGVSDAYLDAQRQDPVLDLVAFHRGMADHVGHGLGNGELEVVNFLWFESRQASDPAHHQTGE